MIAGNPGRDQGDHSNFSGSGSYTFRETGMRSTMTVDAPVAGTYPLYVRYSAGPLTPEEDVTRPMGLLTNGVRKQLLYPRTADWETWAFVTSEVTLNQGANTIALDCDRGAPGDICRLNFDAIQVGGLSPDPCAATPATAGYQNLFDGTLASFDGWRKAGAGGFGRQTDCTIQSFRGRGAEWLTQQQAAPYTLKLDWKRAAADDESSVYMASSGRGGADPVGGFTIPIGTGTGAIVPTGGTAQAPDQAAVTSALHPVGEWNTYLIQVTTSQVRVFLNGTLVNTHSAAQPIPVSGFIGLENRGATHNVKFRSIQTKSGVDAAPGDLAVHYKLDEGSGTSAANTGVDQTVGAATLTGTTTFSPEGVYNGAVNLPGGSNVNAVDLPDNLLQGAPDFTTSFWARPDTKGNWIGMFHIGDGLGDAGSFFQIQMQTQDGRPTGLAATSKAKGNALQERVYADPIKDVTAGQWNHVVFTRQGTTGTLYLNGQQVATRTNLTITMANVGPTTNNWLGRNGYPDPAYDGRMDDVRLYESALTAQEIAAMYADGTAVPTTTDVTVTPPSPSPHDAPVTVSATVADAPAGDAQGQAELWVDGVRVAGPVAVVAGAVSFTNVTLTPGAHEVEVRFIGAAGWRDSSDVTTHTVSSPPPAPGVPVHYTFDEGQGTTSANSGTNASVGPATLQGATGWTQAAQCAGGVNLPGGGSATGNHVTLPNNIQAGMTDAFTVSIWAKPDALPNWVSLVQIGSSTDTFFMLQSSTQANGPTGFAATFKQAGNPTQERLTLGAGKDTPVNEWTHVVYTHGGTTGKIYFDGVLQATRNNFTLDMGDVGVNGQTTANMIGGTSWPDPRYDGAIDEFRMYGYELSAAQVAQLTTECPPVNQSPVGAADAYDTVEGQVLTVAAPGVLTNDTDAEGATLTATAATQPTNGSVTLAANGSFSYTPDAGFLGTDTFTYRANDGATSSAATTVTITVEEVVEPPVNATPVARSDAYATVQGQPLVLPAPGVLMNDTDADDQVLTATAATQPAHGTVALAANGSLTYTPAAGYTGSDSFTYRASDGEASSALATVTITVTPAGGGSMSATELAGVALPITYGQTGSVMVTIAPRTATGSVELSKGTTRLATATIADGRATLPLAAKSLPVGEHVLTLRYGGDATHRASTSSVTVTVVEAPDATASRTVVKTRPGKPSFKDDFRVVVRVRSVLADGQTPTGRVKIRIDGRRIDAGRLEDGRYVLKVTRNLNRGTHMLSVIYTGDESNRWSRDRQKFWVVR